MKRPLEIVSGIGVFVMALVSLMAVLKTLFALPQHAQQLPLISIISLTVTGVAVLLSFVGAFILLSWSIRPK